MTNYETPDLKYLFEPRSVAVVGASKDEFKSGGMFIKRMLEDKFAGQIFPINRKETEIMGLKCYSSVSAIPGEVDLAILAVPAQAILESTEDCARKHVKFAIVHAVGFSEMGAEGREFESKVVNAAQSGGVRLIGPNCMGIYTSRGRINTIVPYTALPMDQGKIGFVGQSGWVSEMFLRHGSERGLRFSGVISIGNQCDLRVDDLIGYWGKDPHTSVIAAYVEGLKDARRFIEIAGRVCPRKPVIIWKGGSSEMGAKSAASHTGSLAGSYQIFQGMCRQTGIIPAYGMEDIIDLAIAFTSPVLPPGNNVGMLIEAGGGGVASVDACAREGLESRQFSTGVQEKLAEYLKGKVPPSNNRKNPVDLVWAPIIGGSRVFVDCMEMIIPEVDICLVMSYAFLHEDWYRQRMAELRDKYKKPVIVVPANGHDQVEGGIMAVKEGIPVYMMPENAVRCIGAMFKRTRYLGSLK
jgi:acyl-CoA synthetase (NDP forming)